MKKNHFNLRKLFTMITYVFVLCKQFSQGLSYGSEEEIDYRENNDEQLEDIREDVVISSIPEKDLPKFVEMLQNNTIPVGREAVLQCVVDNLQTYKIAWLRVDTQTVLTIQHHVITKNHRISITHAEKRAWILRIRDVKESDKGWYMCQINTDPMKSQVGYLNVVVPPDILDFPTSTDMVVREGGNVTLQCAAAGSPPPTITWRRENADPIPVADGEEVTSFDGSVLSINKVNRLNMGPYLCIASNGVPPSVSKRVMLIVHFPPMVAISNQLVGAAIGQAITLECQSEAYPKSINYWMKNDSIIVSGGRFVHEIVEKLYKTTMKLTIRDVNFSDFGTYKCIAKNYLAESDGAIKLYHIPRATTTTTTVTTTLASRDTVNVVFFKHEKEDNLQKKRLGISQLNNVINSNNSSTSSSHWTLQNSFQDKSPTNSSHRNNEFSSRNSLNHEADHFTKNQKSMSTSTFIDTGQNHFFYIGLLLIIMNLM